MREKTLHQCYIRLSFPDTVLCTFGWSQTNPLTQAIIMFNPILHNTKETPNLTQW